MMVNLPRFDDLLRCHLVIMVAYASSVGKMLSVSSRCQCDLDVLEGFRGDTWDGRSDPDDAFMVQVVDQVV